MLTKQENGVVIVMSDEEEATERARWAAEDNKRRDDLMANGWKYDRHREYPTHEERVNALWEHLVNCDDSALKALKQRISDIDARYPAPVGAK